MPLSKKKPITVEPNSTEVSDDEDKEQTTPKQEEESKQQQGNQDEEETKNQKSALASLKFTPLDQDQISCLHCGADTSDETCPEKCIASLLPHKLVAERIQKNKEEEAERAEKQRKEDERLARLKGDAVPLEKLETLTHSKEPRASTFSPDESMFFVGGWWHLTDVFLVKGKSTFEKIGELKHDKVKDVVYCLDCRNGNEIAAGYSGSQIVIFSYGKTKESLANNEKRVFSKPSNVSGCRCLKYSSAAKRSEHDPNPRLVACYEGGTPRIIIYNTESGENLFDYECKETMMGLAWRNNDSEILSCGRSNSGSSTYTPIFAIDPNKKPEQDCRLYDLGDLCKVKGGDSWWLDYDDTTGILAVPSYSNGGVFIFDVNRKKLIANCKTTNASGASSTNGVVLFNRGRAVACCCSGVEVFELPSSATSASSSSSSVVPSVHASFKSKEHHSSCWTLAVSEKAEALLLPDYSSKTTVYRIKGFLFDRRRIVLQLRFLPNIDSHCFEIYSICFIVSSFL